jgi:hypothetical protein
MERGGNRATEAPRGVFMDSKTLAAIQANEVLFALMGAFGSYHVIPMDVFVQAVLSRFNLRDDMPFSVEEVLDAGGSLMGELWKVPDQEIGEAYE